MTRRIRLALVAVALAAVALLAAILGVPTTDDDGPDIATQPLAPAAVADPRQPDTIEVPTADLEQAADALGDHQGARGERPPNVTSAELDAAATQRERLAQRDQLPPTAPLASPSQPGCQTRSVRNYSSRGGVKPRLWVIHYTVSSNRTGWGDVDAITSWFNQPASSASSHYIIDRDGHCRLIVPEQSKAWTQATHNPWSLSAEIVNTGKEGSLTSPAGYRILGRVISDSAKRWGIPLRRGAVSGCTVTRTGIVDHAQLGACGGGHGDIRPYPLEPVIAAALAARRAGTALGSANDRVLCRKLQWFRRQSKPRSAAVLRNAIDRRETLASRGLRCTTTGALARL